MTWRLYGARGWGSAIVEASLAWTGEVFEFIDVEGFDQPGPGRDRLFKVNPLARVPTVITPDGTILAESAAIVLYLAELHPQSGLAPVAGDPRRARFLNQLIWFVSVLYPTFTYRDYPERWAPSATEELKEQIDKFRRTLWRQLEKEVEGDEWVLGSAPCALDIYVCVMSRWRPGREWIAANCPNLHAIALAAERLPSIAAVIKRNFV
jgi:GST-like protein